jgi:GT2 family glycosyltransferase
MASAESTSEAQSPDALGAPTLRASIVIPTHNRRDSLRRTLLALARQSISAERFETLVICDGCTDGSVHMCHELSPELPYRLRVIEQTNSGPAAARNRGVEEALASLIVFLDDDIVPDPALLATHIRAHHPQDNLVTIGPMLPPPDEALSVWAEWENSVVLKEYQAMESGKYEATERQFFTGNAALRKEHLITVGGFNPDFRRAEDVELAIRLRETGVTFAFLPDARSWHYISRSFENWLKTPIKYADADVLMSRAGYPDTLWAVAGEFPNRSLPVRALVRACAGHHRRTRAAESALRRLILQAEDSGKRRRTARAACSLLFNLRYYHQIATLLGGASQFRAFLHTRDVQAALAAMPAR